MAVKWCQMIEIYLKFITNIKKIGLWCNKIIKIYVDDINNIKYIANIIIINNMNTI